MYSQFKQKKEALTKNNKEDVLAKYGNDGEALRGGGGNGHSTGCVTTVGRMGDSSKCVSTE
jgi:NADH:ubiquinone oxidoreductase subunit F (NADH-binding)